MYRRGYEDIPPGVMKVCATMYTRGYEDIPWPSVRYPDIFNPVSSQNIETVVSSPFLRCLQTGQIVCDTLQLPGMVTSNEVMDVLNSSAFIHWQPEVPADNIASYGIKVVSMDTTPVPRYPEETRAGLKR